MPVETGISGVRNKLFASLELDSRSSWDGGIHDISRLDN